MEHLRDFVWMSKDGGEPEQVTADPQIISQKMVAGFVQVFPAAETPKKETK